MTAPQKTRLDTGLTIIARPNRAAHSIAIRVLLAAGAGFDPPEKAGTAALTAGLLDRGAGPLSAAEIAGFFDDLGVAFAAGALRDVLEVELRLLADHFQEVLRRLRLILAEPSFPETEVERQKGQALTAIAERDQDTAAVAEMSLQTALFPEGHPYRRPRLGTRDSVAQIGRADLVAFHRERFLPSGTIVSIAGDIDPDRALATGTETFGTWNGGGGRPVRSEGAAIGPALRDGIPDAPAPERNTIVVRPIEGKSQADIALGFPGLRRRSPDLPAALVLNSVLGEFGLGGRLAKAIREKAGLAYYAYSHFTAGLGAGPFVARAGVAPDRVRRALDLMRRTIERLVRHGVTPAELRDSQQALAASLPRRLETNPDAAEVFADAEFHGLGLDHPQRLAAAIRSVTRPEVNEAARKYLTTRKSVLVVAGPALEKETLA